MKDPKQLLPEEQKDNYKEIQIAQKYPGVEYFEMDNKKVRMVALAIIREKEYKFLFKTTRIMMCVKTVMIWRGILDMFSFQDMEKDKRHIYYNTFHAFGFKVPPIYRLISASGRTGIKLWHQMRGHTHRVWCGDKHAFPVPVNKENLVDLWKQYHLSSYKVSDVVKDIEFGGEEAKEISFEVPNKDAIAELISQLVYRKGKIFSISHKASNKDQLVEFYFVEFPIISYAKAKEIADKICEGLEVEPEPKLPTLKQKVSKIIEILALLGIILLVIDLVYQQGLLHYLTKFTKTEM